MTGDVDCVSPSTFQGTARFPSLQDAKDPYPVQGKIFLKAIPLYYEPGPTCLHSTVNSCARRILTDEETEAQRGEVIRSRFHCP